MQHLYKKIYSDPRFTELVNKKKRFSWLLSIIVMAIYFTFILVIAFVPELFGKPLTDSSVITVGIPAGLFVIISSFLFTGFYTWRANREFDRLNRELLEDYKDE